MIKSCSINRIFDQPNIFAASVSSESNLPANLLLSLLFGDVSESKDVSSLVSRTLRLFFRCLNRENCLKFNVNDER